MSVLANPGPKSSFATDIHQLSRKNNDVWKTPGIESAGALGSTRWLNYVCIRIGIAVKDLPTPFQVTHYVWGCSALSCRVKTYITGLIIHNPSVCCCITFPELRFPSMSLTQSRVRNSFAANEKSDDLGCEQISDFPTPSLGYDPPDGSFWAWTTVFGWCVAFQ
jgi:hypothetical protein